MDQRDQKRAADADREAVAERLRTALNEGRLDLHEYDERLQRAYAAKTYADLDVLLTDLPATVPAERAQVVPVGQSPDLVPSPDGRYPRATRRWLIHTWDSYAGTVATTVAIWAIISVMSGNLGYFWPGWIAGPWGAVLLVNTVRGLAKGDPQRWAATRARNEQEEIERRARRSVEGADNRPED